MALPPSFSACISCKRRLGVLLLLLYYAEGDPKQAALARYEAVVRGGAELLVSGSEVSRAMLGWRGWGWVRRRAYGIRHRVLGLAVVQDNTLHLWKAAEDKRPIVRMTGHQKGVNYVLYSPDGRLIVSASFDKSAKLWDGRTGKCVSRRHARQALRPAPSGTQGCRRWC